MAAAGNPARRRAVAEETLTECLQLGGRVVAIEAAVALSATLRAEAGVAAARRIDEALATADRLIAETGACNLMPLTLMERAGLAELRGEMQQCETHLRVAHEVFARMGATGRAAHVATMLGG